MSGTVRHPLPADRAVPAPSRRDVLVGALLGSIGLGAVLLRPGLTAPRLGDGRIEAAVPEQIGPWRGEAQVGQASEAQDELTARLYDRVLARVYRAAAPGPTDGARAVAALPDIALLVAYGRGQDADVQLHRPDACYPPQGFVLSDPRALPIRLSGRPVPAQIVTASRSDGVQQVLYWTRIANAFPPDAAAERAVILHENLAGRMPDAVLVRLAVAGPDRDAAIAAALRFIAALDAALPADGRRLLIQGFDPRPAAGPFHFAAREPR